MYSTTGTSWSHRKLYSRNGKARHGQDPSTNSASPVTSSTNAPTKSPTLLWAIQDALSRYEEVPERQIRDSPLCKIHERTRMYARGTQVSQSHVSGTLPRSGAQWCLSPLDT